MGANDLEAVVERRTRFRKANNLPHRAGRVNLKSQADDTGLPMVQFTGAWADKDLLVIRTGYAHHPLRIWGIKIESNQRVAELMIILVCSRRQGMNR